MERVLKLPIFNSEVLFLLLLCRFIVSGGLLPKTPLPPSSSGLSTLPSNKSGVPGVKIRCDPLPDFPPGCKCKLSDNGMVIDLSKIDPSGDKNRKARFITKDDYNWFIAWSPCHDFSIFSDEQQVGDIQPCIDTGVARFDSTSKECFGYGNHANSNVTVTSRDAYGRANLEVSFQNTTSEQILKASIALRCDPKGRPPRLVFREYDTMSGTQKLAFHSKCCCENGCTVDPDPTQGPKDNGTTYYILGGSLSALGLVATFAIIKIRRRRRVVIPVPEPAFPVPEVGGRQAVENEEQHLLG